MCEAMNENAHQHSAFAIDTEAVGANSRLVHLALLNLNLRLMDNWRAAQVHSTDLVLDHDTLFIMMATIVIAGDKLLREELDSDLHRLANQLPASKLGKVNLSSIAAATGLHRETVRRKVQALQDAGWVVRDKHGIRPVPGVIPQDALRNIMNAQLEAFRRMANQLTKFGVLRRV
jgi:biotin operon repressor